MFTFDFLIVALGIISTLYAIPYANYEMKNKKIANATVIYTIALASVCLSILQYVL